jgi:hypothetical protein
MPRMRTWLCCVLALASGCIVPRSMVLGQMAAPVGRGATEVGVFSGVQYASQTNPTFDARNDINDPIKTTERTAGFSIPSFEANLQHGFNEKFALNVHASQAGIQPGLKWTLNDSKVANVALLPAVAFGYASTGGATLTSGVVNGVSDGVQAEGGNNSHTSFTFLGGLKLLFSHRSGFYAGVGYDFIFNRNYNAAIVGAVGVTDKQEIILTTTSHQISASVGIDIKLGMVRIRPEVAFAVYPGIGQSRTVRLAPADDTVSSTGGFGFAIFPGFTIAIVSPMRELTEDEIEEAAEKEKAEKHKRRQNGVEEEEDDDDDDEGGSKKPTLKKKAKLDDDDEDANARKKRRPAADDED